MNNKRPYVLEPEGVKGWAQEGCLVLMAVLFPVAWLIALVLAAIGWVGYQIRRVF